jgi:predicted dehydrogenase
MVDADSTRRGAIVGFGNVAEKGHLPGWLSCRGFEIVAVAEPSPERRAVAAKLLPAAALYSGMEELFARQALDFVDIASPPAFHCNAIIAAARVGAHILCEKPLATSAAEYHHARRAVEAAGVVLHTVHNWKHSEAFRLLLGLVKDGTLGPLKHLRFETERNGWSVSENDWRVQRSVAGGGILVDHGWHNLYLALALAARNPRSIAATLERRRYVTAEIEDTASCRIDFDELTAEIHLTWAAERRRTRWTVGGDRGRVVVDDDAVEIDCGSERTARRLAASLSAGSHHADWFPGVLDAFRDEIADPRRCGANRHEAEWVLTLLEGGYASAARGGVVLPLEPPAR